VRTWPGEDDDFEGLAEVLGEGLGGRNGSPQYRWGDFTSTYTDYAVNTNAYGTAIAYGSAYRYECATRSRVGAAVGRGGVLRFAGSLASRRRRAGLCHRSAGKSDRGCQRGAHDQRSSGYCNGTADYAGTGRLPVWHGGHHPPPI
jgi:hypothetical protein